MKWSATTQARSIILAAAGPAFCSGHDLREMTGLDAKAYAEIFAVCTAMMTKIQSVPQPVIAEVQGMATAAGCQLVATCDLAIASEAATFATPGVRIGLVLLDADGGREPRAGTQASARNAADR